ncbi:MAG: hypothetical protein J7J31_01195 [Helicobacteraceae bacterium]|nr:hypothetical protein [Helicobacteraceae bacterium]
MAYIIGLIVVALFFLSLHYFTELTRSQKITISLLTLSIIVAAIAYNSYSAQQRESIMQTVTKFEQNKTVRCEGIDVNSTNFTLSTGTYTFIGKKDSPYYGQMVSASKCQ